MKNLSQMSLKKTVENLFYLIVFLLPWQAIWLWRESFVGGYKWEYGAIGFYGVDIFIVLFLALGLVECFYEKNFKIQISNIKSISNVLISKFKNSKRLILNTSYLILTWSLISIAWSPDKLLALFFSWKLLLAIGLFWVVRRIDLSWNKLVFVLLVAGALQGALGMGQFLAQETFSSKWLGVSQHVPSEGGASVVENSSGRWLRGYGAFPHPNVLGGYLAVILLIIIWKDAKNFQFSIFNNSIFKHFILTTLCLILFSGLIVSFSRSAWLVFASGFAILFFMQKERRKELGKIAIIFSGVALIWISAFSPLFFSRLEGQTRLEQKSLDDRSEYVLQSKEIISENFWLGVGAGNYTAEVAQKNPEQSIWQIQPVHNVFLLVWSELGIIGIVLFLAILLFVAAKAFSLSPILGFLLYALYFLLFFDHWLWTSHFGLLFFFLILGIIFKQIKE